MEVSNSSVAIVIPSAGGPLALSRCVTSIIARTAVSYSICIVSQGDLGSFTLCKKLEEDYPKEIFVHYNEENIPGSRGYNQGIRLARQEMPNFDYICFFDDDMLVLQRGWLNKLVIYADNTPNVGIVGYRMCTLGEPNEKGSVLEFMSCCMLVSRKLMVEIGDMDENLLWHKNDSDYCLRAWQAGFKVRVLNANDSGDMSNDYLYHSHQIGSRRMSDEKELREKTYKIYDEKWKDINIQID